MKAKDVDHEVERRFETVIAAFAADRRLAPVAAALRSERAAKQTRKFGSDALKVNGRIFAMVVRGQLVVKLSKQRVGELVAASAGRQFDPGHGRLMKEWVVILAERCSWIDLAKEAYDFCSQQPPAGRRRKKGSAS